MVKMIWCGLVIAFLAFGMGGGVLARDLQINGGMGIWQNPYTGTVFHDYGLELKYERHCLELWSA